MSRNRSRLSVEVLEDRLVLSTFPALGGLASDLLRFLPQDTASLRIPTGSTSQSSGIPIPGFSGFSGTAPFTDPNLIGFGPVDQGIPGMTATAGPADFPRFATGAATPSPSLSQTQVLALAELTAARLAAAQFLAIEVAQAAAQNTTPTPPTTLPTTTPTPAIPSATLLAAEALAAQLQAARFAAAAAQAQAAGALQTGTTPSTVTGLPGTATINLPGLSGTGGVFSNNGTGLNPFLPAGGFAVAPATGATGAGVFSGIGGGTNAALPAGGFPVLGRSTSTLGSTLFAPATQTTSTASNGTTNPLAGMNPFNNALAASGLPF
jgi:hypothetical protein